MAPLTRPPGGLTIGALIAWLTGKGVTLYGVAGPNVPDTPDRLYVASLQPGAGFLLEGGMDAPSFQLRVRGAQGDYADAESSALLLDYVICTGWPTQIGGVQVGVMGRVGGAPAPAGPYDNARRSEFTCSYYAKLDSYLT